MVFVIELVIYEFGCSVCILSCLEICKGSPAPTLPPHPLFLRVFLTWNILKSLYLIYVLVFLATRHVGSGLP